MNLIRSGCTLYISDRAGPHLWVVLDDPVPPRDEVPLVMLVTRKKHTDETLILHAGDHPFIEHETAVSYSTLRFLPVRRLTSLMTKERCELRGDVTENLLARIREGVFNSPHTIHAHRDRCQELFG